MEAGIAGLAKGKGGKNMKNENKRETGPRIGVRGDNGRGHGAEPVRL
jgi:hypothetical protein